MKINAGDLAIEFFNQFTAEKKDELDLVYASDIDFKDPVCTIQSREKLKSYFANQYKNVLSCEFESLNNISHGRSSSVEWKMYLRHKYLKLGQTIKLQGCSVITLAEGEDLIIRQRDYFDLGAAVANSIPYIDVVKSFLPRMQ